MASWRWLSCRRTARGPAPLPMPRHTSILALPHLCRRGGPEHGPAHRGRDEPTARVGEQPAQHQGGLGRVDAQLFDRAAEAEPQPRAARVRCAGADQPGHGARAVCRRLCVQLERAGRGHAGAAGAQPGGGSGQPHHPPRHRHHPAQPGRVHGARRKGAAAGHAVGCGPGGRAWGRGRVRGWGEGQTLPSTHPLQVQHASASTGPTPSPSPLPPPCTARWARWRRSATRTPRRCTTRSWSSSPALTPQWRLSSPSTTSCGSPTPRWGCSTWRRRSCTWT